MSTITTDTHIVSCPIGDTGHLRPTLALLTNIVRVYPSVLITLFVLKTLVVKVNDEFGRSGCADVSRIQVIGVSDIDFVNGSDRVFIGKAVEELNKLVPEAYETIVAGGALTCSATGKEYDYSNIPSPTLALSDILTPYFGQAIKRITPDIKLLVVCSVPASFAHRVTGPKDLGGMGQWGADIKELMARDSKLSFTEAAMSFVMPTGKDLVNPEEVMLYDYELMPQLDSSAGDIVQTSLDATWQSNVLADGLILPITETWEPKTSRAYRKWYEQGLGKKLFFVGQRYQSKPLNQSVADDSTITSRYPKIFEFLDAQTPRSTWLIAFGSVYYPYAHPEQLYAVIRTLVRNKTPFVLARSGLLVQKSAPIPQDLLEEVEKSGLGLIVDYVPQEAVLNHSSIGAFLTHGGMNSLQETVQAGVTPILWPFDVDQPFNAAYMSQELDCAFELIQVRTGPGAQPPRRGGTVVGTEDAIAAEVTQIIEDLRGEVGARKRHNFGNVRAKFLNELGEGGAVHQALNNIVMLAAPSTK